MLLKTLVAAAGFAAATTAFLIPPEISSAEADIITTLPFIEAAQRSQWPSINLTCTGCPFQYVNHDGEVKTKYNRPNHLLLDFEIQHGDDHDRLRLNGFELYPNPDPLHSVLAAHQVPDERKPSEHHHHKEHKEHDGEKDAKKLESHHKKRPKTFVPIPQPLGFGLQVRHLQTNKDDKMSLLGIELEIIEVGNQFVSGIPKVQIMLIQNGPNLLINRINTAESTSVSKGECDTMLCKLKAFIDAHLSHLVPHKHCGGHRNATHHRHHGHHGHHDGHKSGKPFMTYHGHSWGQLFQKFAKHILQPVLVGIVAGVTVSIIGMIVGTILVGLWRKFVRGQTFFPHHCRRRAGHHHHKAASKEAAVAEEKSGLIEHQDLPPSYEDGEMDKRADEV